MAGEELLDRAVRFIRYQPTDDMPDSRKHEANQIIAEYDAHQQRAGEEVMMLRKALVRAGNATDGRVSDECSSEFLSHVGEEVELCIAGLRKRLADPATVRVPREPTEAMLRTLADLLVLYLHPDATDLDDLDSRKFDDSGIHVDIGRYLRSPEGKSFLDRASTPASSPTAEDVRDAERYRFLRNSPINRFPGLFIAEARSSSEGDYLNEDDADQEIDQAIARQRIGDK